MEGLQLSQPVRTLGQTETIGSHITPAITGYERKAMNKKTDVDECSGASPLLSSFEAGTGLMGATASGQRVTAENVSELPIGSVVRIGDGSRLIHLHDDLWLWCCDTAWCYDRVDRLAWRLDDKSVACHVAG